VLKLNAEELWRRVKKQGEGSVLKRLS
jgi:hypothetical protein